MSDRPGSSRPVLGLLPRQKRKGLHNAKTGDILISPYPENGGLMVGMMVCTVRLLGQYNRNKYCASGFVVPVATPRAAHVRSNSYVTSCPLECRMRETDAPSLLGLDQLPWFTGKKDAIQKGLALWNLPSLRFRRRPSGGVRRGNVEKKHYNHFHSVYLAAVPIRAPIRAPTRSRCTWYSRSVRLLGMRKTP